MLLKHMPLRAYPIFSPMRQGAVFAWFLSLPVAMLDDYSITSVMAFVTSRVRSMMPGSVR